MVLVTLNRSLAGQLQGGFVTCCVVLITGDGRVTFSNAGHLSPYHNAEELPVAPGLPLGIDPRCEYEESCFLLRPQDSLTFVSDGVIEARNVSGELFGFDRMLKFAKSSAKTIAQEAIDFGQDDDITVVTLTRIDNPDLAGTAIA
jgi:sigma-B regulation protein RsbU (phosphoserine phosphatase)